MKITDIQDVKHNLMDLIQKVAQGEQIIIGEQGTPIAILSPYKKSLRATRSGGQWKDKVWIAEDFDKTPEDIIKSFEGDLA